MLEKNARVLSVEGMDFCYIGKLILDCTEKDWNFPHFHFLVNKAGSHRYESICLEMGVEAVEKSAEESIVTMIEHVHIITDDVKSKEEFSNLVSSANNHLLDDFWRFYRVAEFNLAYKKKDLSNRLDEKIVKAIEKLVDVKFSEKVEELIGEQFQMNPKLKEVLEKLTAPKKPYGELQVTKITHNQVA